MAVRGIMFKKIDGASKNNNFQKSLSKKIYLSRRYLIFKSKKVGHFPQTPQTYQWKTNENRFSRFPIFIDFPLKVSRILGEISDLFALENNISPRKINIFC